MDCSTVIQCITFMMTCLQQFTLTSFSLMDQLGTSPSPSLYHAMRTIGVLIAWIASGFTTCLRTIVNAQLSIQCHHQHTPYTFASLLYQTIPLELSTTSFATGKSSANHSCYSGSIINHRQMNLCSYTVYLYLPCFPHFLILTIALQNTHHLLTSTSVDCIDGFEMGDELLSLLCQHADQLIH